MPAEGHEKGPVMSQALQIDLAAYLELSVSQGAKQVAPDRRSGLSQRRLSNLGCPESQGREVSPI
jgi:hypothetical protein